MITLFSPKAHAEFELTKEESTILHSLEKDGVTNYFSKRLDVDTKKINSQLTGRLKIKQKLPTWRANNSIAYPSSLALEQCSSERCAIFKASLLQGETFIDLNTGFGVDALFFAKNFTHGILIEQQDDLLNIVAHNFTILGCKNVQLGKGDAQIFLQEFTDTVDLIYVDPARRSKSGNKVFTFQETEPNVLEMMPDLLRKGKHILIKCSPLLDIELACKQLSHVKNVYVVDVYNECKEILFHAENGYSGEPTIHAVHLEEQTASTFSFTKIEEKNEVVPFSAVQKFVYEPFACVLKAGAFKSMASKNNVSKLHPHTHLYTSDTYIPAFMGRAFRVIASCVVQKKEVLKIIPDGKANFVMRNFPGNMEDVKKKLGIKDGGNIFVFAITDFLQEKILLVTERC